MRRVEVEVEGREKGERPSLKGYLVRQRTGEERKRGEGNLRTDGRKAHENFAVRTALRRIPCLSLLDDNCVFAHHPTDLPTDRPTDRPTARRTQRLTERASKRRQREKDERRPAGPARRSVDLRPTAACADYDEHKATTATTASRPPLSNMSEEVPSGDLDFFNVDSAIDALR
ncbi:unnamed protein product [Soboliphyme baturini]|uniref:Uncharacterized protein n=1 Tax=Soboliphyme baturini TaxID=241478 RepID=A0A183IVT8_9BILA|nr:unnamed protein product [Soboliphyme baturini]